MKAIQKKRNKKKGKDKEEDDDSMIESISLFNPSQSPNQRFSSLKTLTLKCLPILS